MSAHVFLNLFNGLGEIAEMHCQGFMLALLYIFTSVYTNILSCRRE